MANYIMLLLPDNAELWMFSLAETYFGSLTPKIQADMTQHGFNILSKSWSPLKSAQLEALHEVRTHATQSHERLFINHCAITYQIESSLTNVGSAYSGIVSHHFKQNATQEHADYKDLRSDPSMTTLTEDDIHYFLTRWIDSPHVRYLTRAQTHLTVFGLGEHRLASILVKVSCVKIETV